MLPPQDYVEHLGTSASENSGEGATQMQNTLASLMVASYSMESKRAVEAPARAWCGNAGYSNACGPSYAGKTNVLACLRLHWLGSISLG